MREATKALVSRNILEVHRGNGTFVCEQTGLVQDPLGLRFQPDKKRLGLDLCEVRLMIEPEIAALAAQKATEEEIARMQALCDAIGRKVRRNENYGAPGSAAAYALGGVYAQRRSCQIWSPF